MKNSYKYPTKIKLQNQNPKKHNHKTDKFIINPIFLFQYNLTKNINKIL